jgi:hypothetical protein
MHITQNKQQTARYWNYITKTHIIEIWNVMHIMQIENAHNAVMLAQNTNKWSFHEEMKMQCKELSHCHKAQM